MLLFLNQHDSGDFVASEYNRPPFSFERFNEKRPGFEKLVNSCFVYLFNQIVKPFDLKPKAVPSITIRRLLASIKNMRIVLTTLHTHIYIYMVGVLTTDNY